jgi:hypothetical protein
VCTRTLPTVIIAGASARRESRPPTLPPAKTRPSSLAWYGAMGRPCHVLPPKDRAVRRIGKTMSDGLSRRELEKAAARGLSLLKDAEVLGRIERDGRLRLDDAAE